MQELLTEAQLEAGHDSLETMDFGDETFDDSGHPDDLAAEPAGGPLLSEFFKMCSQEQQQCPNQPANVALLRVGLLGCSPLQLTIAIRIEHQSSFSVQAITKVLCALHNVTYFRQLREQFSNVFDIYLHILREVQSRVDGILGKDSNNWQMNGACPSCAFKQPDEPMLSPARLHAMDGNFSAKRLDGSGSADLRQFCSRYFISEAEVEQFKDDVQRRASTTNTTTLGACTENWTAAKAVDDTKITVFDQTGIFLVACRHGIIECVTEMRRSGELYVFLFSFSLLRNHPLYLNGLGLEDLETCERIFASSNSAAFLDLHFDQWDMDRYTELSTFLYNNYVQALQIIETNTPLLEEFKQFHNLTDMDFINWRNEEYDYLSNIAVEPTSDVIAVAYVEHLEKLYFAEAMYGRLTSVPFMTYTPANFTPTSGLNAAARNSSRAFESEHASALRKYELQLNVVEDFEHRHSITERWLPHDPRYAEAARYTQERQFIRSVEELEGLVVWRLFELSKANLAGTGYKMRKHISKAITRRSAAIRSALEKYNKLAPLQNPPRPVLEYSEIVGYASLGEFSLLKHSRHDILTKPWTVSANCEMAMKYFKLVRLHEEIVRLNVEIKRLQSWVEHEDRTILEAIDSLLANDPDSLLAAELKILYHKHRGINNIHHKRLQQIYVLNRYTGERPATDQTVMAPDEDRDDKGSLDNHEDDAVNEEAIRLEDLVSHLTL
ncbi:hypothetical protein F4604DRAFT_1880377 [Suillus subluteus]|nr:hypothetical protein F4604DRAFT_1880377 [Suillus subluteus]